MVDTEQYQLELETLRDTISAPMATATTIKPMAMPTINSIKVTPL